MFALKMAHREFRASWKKFTFAILAIGIGVGAVTGVQGFGRALKRSLLREGKHLIASDLLIRMSALPKPEEMEALQELKNRGADITHATETVSMVGVAEPVRDAATRRRGETETELPASPRLRIPASPRPRVPASPPPRVSPSQTPILVSLKAVEPGYPFFGVIELEPAGSLHEILKNAVVVSRDLLLRLSVKAGDHIRIGRADFVIGAALIKEPDRIASGLEFGPRVLLSQAALQRTGLMQFGSRATQSYLIRLPARGLDVDSARRVIRERFSDRVRVLDYRDPNPNLSRSLDRMSMFLSLTGLFALLVGGLGVATSMHAYLQQKMDNIAVMKSLGGRSSQILRVYLTQTLMVAFVGSLLGLAIGIIVQTFFPWLLRGLLELQTEVEWSPAVLMQGMGIGLLSTTGMVLPSLLAIRRVKALQIFRRLVDEGVSEWRPRLQRWGEAILVAAGNLAVIGTIASWLAGSWRRGFGFVGIMVALLCVLWVSGTLLFRLFRKLPRLGSFAVRHGLSNLRRPGSQAALIFAVLAVGVTFTLTVHLLQISLLLQFVRSAPPDFPNLILIGITEQQRPALWALLRSWPGVFDAGEPVAAVPARLVSVDGRNIGDRILDEDERRFSRTEFSLTWAREMPRYTTLLQGKWWKGKPDRPQISVGQFAARSLRLRPGALLVFQAGGKEIGGTVANLRETESIRPGSNNQFIFSPGALEGLPVNYVGSIRARADALPLLQKRLFEEFPTVTSVNITEILAIIQRMLDRVSLVIQFVAGFAILTAIVVLASSVASTRYRRVREAVLLKTLGARRAQVVIVQAVEFATIGLLGGLAGSVFASWLASILLGRLFKTDYEFRWMPLAVTVLVTPVLTVLAGWLASRSILSQKPLEVLREE